jgi:hypothetical protein
MTKLLHWIMMALFAIAIGVLLGGIGAFVFGIIAIILPIQFFGGWFMAIVALGFVAGFVIGFFGTLGTGDTAVRVNINRDQREGE